MVAGGKEYWRMKEMYLVFCRSRGLEHRTIEVYEEGLDILGEFMEENHRGEELSKTHIRSLIAQMLKKGLSRGTISVRMRAVRTFCIWMEKEELVEVSPFKGVEIPKLPKALPKSLNKEQVRKLVRARPPVGWRGIRNFAMLLTFLDTGIRLGELINLDLNDLNLHDWSMRIRHGKGDKERNVFIGRKLHRTLRQWISARGISVSEDALFVSKDGVRLDKANVRHILYRTAWHAGLEGKVSPHVVRHTFAVMYIQNGGDAFSLQRIMGHSDVSTTSIYVHLAGATLREAHAKASPLDRL